MTDIRDLLADVTADLDVRRPDLVALVRRRAAVRRRWQAATVAGVAAVIAAVVVVSTSLFTGSGSTPAVGPNPTTAPPTTPPTSTVETWTTADGDAASGFGAVWGLACCDRITGASWVDELNPTTGARIARIAVPTPTSTIGVGAGDVWVIGANAGGGGPSSITAIDPTTHQVSTIHLTNPQAEPYRMTFAHGSAWVTMPLLNQVWRVTVPVDPGASGLLHTVVSVSGTPWTIAATGNGAVWVQRRDINRLSRILSRGSCGLLSCPAGPGEVGETVVDGGEVFSAAASMTLWTGGRRTLIQEAPAMLRACSACAQYQNLLFKGGPITDAITTPRGLFVESSDRTLFLSAYDVSHFDNGYPNASIPYGGGSLASDGRGVVIGAGQAGLVHWVPAATGHSPGRPASSPTG
jgi:hypothetical protein